MVMKHLLLEVFCDCNSYDEKPMFCHNGFGEFGQHCFSNNCRFLSYTSCPYEIAFTNKGGVINSQNDWIGFGGDMEPDTNEISERNILLSEWERICKKKIQEAYHEYMVTKRDLKL